MLLFKRELFNPRHGGQTLVKQALWQSLAHSGADLHKQTGLITGPQGRA